MKQFRENMKRSWKNPKFILGTVFLLLTILMICAVIWRGIAFNTVDFEQLLYNLMSPSKGANNEVLFQFLWKIVPITLILSFVLSTILITLKTDDEETQNKRSKGKAFINFIDRNYMKITLTFMLLAAVFTFVHIGGVSYLKHQFIDKSEFYETEYVDPKEVKLSFPKEKRNLIYIFCESMENSFMSSEYGGAQEENYIPELTKLMEENTSFYNTDVSNGAEVTYNCDWTVAAMTAHTSAIPLVLPVGENEESYTQFLPGVTNLGDILKAQGYNQELIIGSDVSFGGRDNLFKVHGQYEIFDYYTAIERGYIPEDYYEFWGYEDKKLFEYAKTEIMNQYAKGAPFNVTLLTVDTHFIEGYQCEDCLEVYDDPYLNTLNCSSKKIYEFVEWVKGQEFYDNTTIVIAGDHLNMGGDYTGKIDREYHRTTYFTIVNPAIEYQGNGEHLYSTLDYFPTTLAALGVEIEGNRLGLGTNLFATEVDTLCDKYGYEGLHEELSKSSDYYNEKFLGKITEQ